MRVITNTNVSSKLTFEGNDPSGRSRWASVLRAATPTPLGAYSYGLGLPETFTRLRLRSSGSSPLEAASSKISVKTFVLVFLSFLTASALMLERQGSCSGADQDRLSSLRSRGPSPKRERTCTTLRALLGRDGWPDSLAGSSRCPEDHGGDLQRHYEGAKAGRKR